ncbi:flexible cuticle protein 12-like [Agrilus planipennis]|uniref:Flexible cuticle protein 12-like n=1 Tax=Agrilus planipennis TaxID=224129 RepID=A0A1W4WKB3_AGRPL|nr:flexible cuticle protein 12-like [Agrilus planipennis]
MKVIIALAALVAVATAAPQAYPYQQNLDTDKDAVVLKYDSENLGIDHYNYAYEISNGISSQENGEVVNTGAENQSIVVRGQYSFVAPDGNTYTVSYVADDNGFQPQGAHIPQNTK